MLVGMLVQMTAIVGSELLAQYMSERARARARSLTMLRGPKLMPYHIIYVVYTVYI